MRVIIVGCGRTGAGLAHLLTQRGHAITVIDRDIQAFERLGASFAGETLVGPAFDRETLLRAGVLTADALAAVTDSDESNVVVARIAREVFQVPKVVARLYDPLKAEIYQRLGLQIVAQGVWGINRIADLLGSSPLDVLCSLGGGEVEIVEVEVPALLVGRRVVDLAVPGEVHVVAIGRRGRCFLPTLHAIFQKDDLLVIAVIAASLERLKTLLAV